MYAKDFFSALLRDSENLTVIVDLQRECIAAQSALFEERYGISSGCPFLPENYADFYYLSQNKQVFDCDLIFRTPRASGMYYCSFIKLPFPVGQYALGFFCDEPEDRDRLPYVFFRNENLEFMYGSLNLIKDFKNSSFNYSLFNEKYAAAYIAEDLQAIEKTECYISKHHFMRDPLKDSALVSKIPLISFSGKTAGLMYVLRYTDSGFMRRAEKAAARFLPSGPQQISAFKESASADVLKNIVHNTPTIAMRVDVATQAISYIHSSKEFLGYRDEEQLIGSKWSDYVFDGDYKQIEDACKKIIAEGGNLFTFEYRMKRADGSPIWVSSRNNITRASDGTALHIDCVITDSHKRKLAQIESERKLSLTNLQKDVLSFFGANRNVEEGLLDAVNSIGKELSAMRCGIIRRVSGGYDIIRYEGGSADKEVTNHIFERFSGALHGKRSLVIADDPWLNPGESQLLLAPVYLMGVIDGILYATSPQDIPKDTADFFGQMGTHTENFLTKAQMLTNASDSENLCKIFEHSTVAVFIIEPDTHRIIYSNELFNSVFGGVTNGKRCHEVMYGIGVPCSECLLRSGGDVIKEQSYCALVDKWFDIFCRKIMWKDGKPVFLIQLVDISLTKEYQTKAEQFASFDPVTALPNRQRAETDVSRLMSMSKSSGLTGYLLYFDLDNFKNVNDVYGHDIGNKLLKVIGTSVKSICASNQVLYRFDGDQFLIVCQNDTETSIKRLVDTLLLKGAGKWVAGGKEIYCTLSIGVVRYPDGCATFNELLKRIDIAIYNAKQNGRACASYYDSPLFDGASLARKMEMEIAIRKSMERNFDGFTLHYQPIVNMKTGQLLGTEALIRYRGRDGKLIPPSEFVPLCEETGLIRPLGIWIIRKGIEVCKAINDEFDPDFTMSINLSIKQIEQIDLTAVIEGILVSSGVNPRNIIIELTETAALKDYDRLRETLNGMKKSGVQLALDDFGTGYSSLYLLRAAPFDHIKIDMSYTADIFNKDGNSASFISLVTGYAHTGGRTICAEGIETAEQRAYLSAENVDKGQGYYFSKPLSGSALFELLRKKIKILPL